MTIDTNTIVSVTEANQNFSRVTRIAETNGQAVIFKNNRPKYMLVDLAKIRFENFIAKKLVNYLLI